MMSIELAHAAKGRMNSQSNENKQKGKFNISSEEKSYLMNVLEKWPRPTYFVVSTNIYG